ncbi:MAG: DUF1836 domain-containing protein [Defluviitaleaceae bacterium]|nr:DUF1836 domain-containing protein [Defluviitaleaceae bacterium]
MKSILKDINQYNHHFTISQVVTFFDRKGLIVTKSMIQNYVRDKLLRPPVNKRYYTHKHLANLALITKLKTVYEISEVRAVLLPFMDGEGIPLEIYENCVQKTEDLKVHPQSMLEPTLDTLVLMAHSIDLKEEARKRL